ncbi:MAG: exodeoxyribonuclease VII small subunit [Bacteroidia bacterium]
MDEKFSLEDKLAEIRALVEKMQKGISDFDQQVTLFKKGNELIESCRKYLEAAEMEIEKLMEET